MDPIKAAQDTEFVLRRLQDMPSTWLILLPVAFAFFVLFLVVLFRRENRWAGMHWAFLGVTAFSVLHVFLALIFLPTFSWWVILVPVLGVALFYVGLMYLKDAQTIHPLWAGFLGLLRCAVYAILAFVFLLPGLQNYETNETHSKVVFLFDVSGSMNTVDDLPQLGEDPGKLPTRQDKVLKFLTNPNGQSGKEANAFLARILGKTPITAYRFGAVTDDANLLQVKENDNPKAEAWTDWLKPDKKKIVVPTNLPAEEQPKYRAKMNDLYDDLVSGTNVGGAAQLVTKLEASSFLQAIVIISDGQSNLGSDEAIKEFLARVNNPKRPVPVFTVGVGDYRTPASIRIDDLQAPETARPDDKFPVRIPVVGTGLPDEEFDVTLEVRRLKDKDNKLLANEKTYVLGPKKGKFKGAGDHPHGQVEFEIDIQDLKSIKADKDERGDLEGIWQFVAKVPRHPREAFAKAEHVSDPATQVLVMKRKLRVLLFAGGPTREYQFVRTLLYRQVTEKRLDMAVYLQTGGEDHVDQDVDKEWLLTHFPDKLGPDDPRDKHSSLNEYDVIIAFDPDWTALDYQQLKNLEQWVSRDSGGVIFVAGPVHTFQLARPGGLDITPLLNIFPVGLKDSRLHSLGIGHDPSRPYVLNFESDAKLFEFMKLDETGETPTAGWDGFFWEGKPPPAKDARPLRGIFNYYPVEKLRPASRVIATFGGPPASRIEDGKKEQPFLVMLPVGSGKTFYIGSGETWRLRQFKEAFHERFWIKLARFVSAGTTEQKKYGRILLGRSASTGTIAFEAQVKGENLQPLPRDQKPTVQVKRPADFDPKLDPDTPAAFDLRAKSQEGEWHGWFVGNFKARTPGEYEFRIPIPGTSEALTHRLTVRKPNLELDNVRHNHGALYQLASDAATILNRLPAETRREIERQLQPPSSEDLGPEGRGGSRLFFTLPNADAIAKCLTKVEPKRESTKGKLEDLWDRGWESGMTLSAFWLLLLIPAAVGLLAFGILLFLRQNLGAFLALGVTALVVLVVLFLQLLQSIEALEFEWEEFPLNFSFVMAAVVSLLAVEWLTRKLLRLA